MLSKQFRLNRTDFSFIYKKGRRVRGKFFGLIILIAENQNEPSKIGIVVGSQVHKNATSRNKLKRQIRTVLTSNLLKEPPLGLKIILTAFPDSRNLKFTEIKQELAELFAKAALLK